MYSLHLPHWDCEPNREADKHLRNQLQAPMFQKDICFEETHFWQKMGAINSVFFLLQDEVFHKKVSIQKNKLAILQSFNRCSICVEDVITWMARGQKNENGFGWQTSWNVFDCPVLSS